jgi:hypothetical protein
MRGNGNQGCDDHSHHGNGHQAKPTARTHYTAGPVGGVDWLSEEIVSASHRVTDLPR